ILLNHKFKPGFTRHLHFGIQQESFLCFVGYDHPPANIAKMADGIPLTDADRAPWLESLRTLIGSCLRTDKPGVLACSALKERYRQTLLRGNPGTQLVYLKGSYNLIWSRMVSRPGHYMKPEMLKSQFDALEEPRNALTIDISLSVEQIVNLLYEELA
ncbi:MAG: gluconokinase, GntK/IdnK-type, partial [Anaerolineales bacterium]